MDVTLTTGRGTMTDHDPAHTPTPVHEDEARRWVRRKRNLDTILAIHVALSLRWFAFDMADRRSGTDG